VNIAYTQFMHSIDNKWSDLAAGYQAVRLLQASLETEFGRALQVGQKQTYRKKRTEWQKKRRAFFAMVALAPLSIITLVLAAFYVHDAACVIVYWIMLVMIILVTLVVAGRTYIREMLNPPKPDTTGTLPVNLEERWWESISSQEPTTEDPDEREKSGFLYMLGRQIPEPFLVVREPALLVLSPSGVWLFQVVSWSGAIARQEGAWKQIETVKRRGEPELFQVQTRSSIPDDEWVARKQEILEALNVRLPQQDWSGELIQGGVVFTHPQAVLEKARIQGNSAAYGQAGAWIERIRTAPAVEELTLEAQLEILDALWSGSDTPGSSARDEAERLYQAAAVELRQSVARLVA
jgi:hypothetical protein